jgi:hypothetical protein
MVVCRLVSEGFLRQKRSSELVLVETFKYHAAPGLPGEDGRPAGS